MKILLHTLRSLILVLFIANIQAQPTFSLPDLIPKTGQQFCIPLSVQDFTDLNEIQFQLIWDPQILNFLSIHLKFIIYNT